MPPPVLGVHAQLFKQLHDVPLHAELFQQATPRTLTPRATATAQAAAATRARTASMAAAPGSTERPSTTILRPTAGTFSAPQPPSETAHLPRSTAGKPWRRGSPPPPVSPRPISLGPGFFSGHALPPRTPAHAHSKLRTMPVIQKHYEYEHHHPRNFNAKRKSAGGELLLRYRPGHFEFVHLLHQPKGTPRAPLRPRRNRKSSTR